MRKDVSFNYFFEENSQKKEPFIFEYIRPCLDWYEIIKVEIKPEDYCYFKLQRRYGVWWLIGENPPVNYLDGYTWTEKEIGEIENRDVIRFIEWAKSDFGGSKLIEISAISGSINILQEVGKLFKFN